MPPLIRIAMKDSSRQALARLLSDLIKSDDLITISELDGFDAAAKRFGLTDGDLAAASGITLSEAFRRISSETAGTLAKVKETMFNVAMRDNGCCRAESIMLTAMDYVFEGNARIFSMAMQNRRLIDSQIVYLEDSGTLPGREVLDEHFEEMRDIARLGGFELIYIPEVARHFRSHSEDGSLRRLIQLISPQSESIDMENTMSALGDMTTRFFYQNVIRGKLDMQVEIPGPSWLIRLPDNNVNGIGYVNYMCIEAESDLKGQLLDFIGRLNSRLSAYTVTVNDGKTDGRSFLYSGFYKALLDLMSVRKIDKWDLHFRLYGDGAEPFRYSDEDGNVKKCVLSISRGGDELPIPVTGRDAAFYLLLICASARGCGIDFHDESLRETTQERYSAIYHALSRRTDEPLVWDPVFRVPMRSRISTAINASDIARVSSLQALYLPTDEQKGMIHVAIEPSRVFLHSPSDTTPLLDSPLFTDLF